MSSPFKNKPSYSEKKPHLEVVVIQPSAVDAAQPLYPSAAVPGVVIQPSEPGIPSHVLCVFVPHPAVVIQLDEQSEPDVPSHVLCLFVPQFS